MLDTLTNAWFYQLKAGNRLLIKKNGGIETAAEITSLSKSQIGRCHNDTDPELLPIPAVLRLEAECGQPIITSIMAGLHGRKISDPASDAPDGQGLLLANAELLKLVGEYSANMGLALSDLHVSPAEGTRGIKDLQRVRDQLDELIRIFANAKASGGASIIPIRVGGEG